VIAADPATRVFLVSGATDMRKGFDGLADLVRTQLGEEPLSGHLFVFANATRTRLKILFGDGSGLWVCSKRLERGRFNWPSLEVEREDDDGLPRKIRLSSAELSMLLGGLDFSHSKKRSVPVCAQAVEPPGVDPGRRADRDGQQLGGERDEADRVGAQKGAGNSRPFYPQRSRSLDPAGSYGVCNCPTGITCLTWPGGVQSNRAAAPPECS